MSEIEIKLIKILEENSDYNVLITSMYLYNILEDSENFSNENLYFDGYDMRIGSYLNRTLYLEVLLLHNEVILTFDKAKLRNNKIDQILYNKPKLKEKRLRLII